MSSFENPTPLAEAPPTPPAITPFMIETLRKTKPWVRFLSIIGFINTGFLIVTGLFLVLAAGFLQRMGNSPLGGVPAILIGGLYAIMGIIYIAPALFLFRYADGIQKALTKDLVPGMEYALKNQKSFWTFVGMMVLIGLILMVAAILLLVIVGVAGLAGLRSIQG